MPQQPQTQINQEQLYNQYLQQQQSNDYEYQDLNQSYGSIIKELTDTDKILDEFELRLRGRKRDAQGKIEVDPDADAYITTEKAARTFMDIVKSQVNRHNDFSFYTEKEVYEIVFGANYTICRWLMLQGEQVPLRYRSKIAFEAMSLISASLHKAMNGRMLTWTKGSFREGRTMGEQQQKSNIWEYIFPFGKKKG